MKFVYNFANLQDLKALHSIVNEQGENIPTKSFDHIKTSVKLKEPLVIFDYLKNANPSVPLDEFSERENWKNGFPDRPTEFHPSLTDSGLCMSYNSKLEKDVFEDSVVNDFIEVFHQNVKGKVEEARSKEFSFIIDTQLRMHELINDDSLEVPIIARYSKKGIQV